MDALDSVTSEATAPTEPSVQQTLNDLSSKVEALNLLASRLTESNDVLVGYLRHNLAIGLLREPND